jgi:hypothetical protein
MYPRARWVFYVLAWGCGATRVLSHGHYLSDVTFGALLGWAVGWGVWMQWGGVGGSGEWRVGEERRVKGVSGSGEIGQGQRVSRE